MFCLKLLLLFCLLYESTCSRSNSVYGFCSQVYNMNQFCMNQISGSTDVEDLHNVVHQPRIGKKGPMGEKGSRGDPGIVNYTAIEETIARKLEETENRLDAKIARLEQLLEEQELKNDVKFDKMKNDTNDIQKEIKRMTLSGCENASKEDQASVKNDKGGLFIIFPSLKYEVYCDLVTDGGGWTVFQRRIDGSENFNRPWEDYAQGFGNKTGEFWLGLETIHQLTKEGTYELRIDLSDWNGNVAYAKYSNFKVSGRSDNYRLTVSGYSGNAGHGLSGHSNMQFSAPDKDLDTWSDHCASYLKSGWWFYGCINSNLNGEYLRNARSTSAANAGIMWYRWKSQALKTSVMMFRKIS